MSTQITMPEPPPIPRPKLPVFGWVIAGYYFATAFVGLLAFLFLPFIQALPLPQEQRLFLGSRTWVDHTFGTAQLVADVVGGAFLLLLRPWALYVFWLGFAIDVFAIAYQILGRHMLSILGPAALAGLPAAFAIRLIVIFYTRSLVKKGILR